MKLLGNWSDPQIEDEDDATVLYQMLGFFMFLCGIYNLRI